MRDFKLEIRINVEKIYFNCLSKISCRKDVFLSVELFNQVKKSDYYPAKFPLRICEVFEFKEFFLDSPGYFRILETLHDIPFTLEMYEYDYGCCKETRLAYFDTNASDITEICSLSPVTMNHRKICMVNKYSLNDIDPPIVVFSSYAHLSQLSADKDETCYTPSFTSPSMKKSRHYNSIPNICRTPPSSICTSSQRSPMDRCSSICSTLIKSPIRITPPFYCNPKTQRSPVIDSRSRCHSSRRSPVTCCPSVSSSYSRLRECRSASPPRIYSSRRRMRSISPLACSSRRSFSPKYNSRRLTSFSPTAYCPLKYKYNDSSNLELSRLTRNLQEVSQHIRQLTSSQKYRMGISAGNDRSFSSSRPNASYSLPCKRPVLYRWTV